MTLIKRSLHCLPLVGLLVLTGCGKAPVEEQQSDKARPVKLITIKAADDGHSTSYPATVEAVQSSRLAFQVSGKMTELNVIAAQEVKQGDVLAKLEQRDFVNKVTSAKAQYKNALSEFNRAKKLSSDGVLSASQLDQLESQMDVAKASLDSAEKALADSVLIAPYDGMVIETNGKALENVSPGQTVVSLMGKGQMEAIVNIPADIVAKANREQEPSASVVLDAAPDREIHATFRRANLEADPTTQTYQVKFAFTPPEDLMVLPGMNARLKISYTLGADEQMAAVSVPVFAISSDQGQSYVWLVDQNTMAVSKRTVQIEQGIGEMLLVTAGLEEGDVIVGAGASYLAQGMKVQAWVKP